MTHFKTFLTMTSAAALITGTAAVADVTAAQVWNDWKENLSIYGDDAVTIGSESALGGTVTVSDITLDFSDDTTAINADLGDLSFVELGDGTVRVTMADNMPMSIKPKSGGGGAEMTITNTGLSILVSGTPDAINYDVQADQYGVRMTELINEFGDVMEGDVYIAANNFDAQYTTSGDTLRMIDYSVNLGSADVLVDITDPAGSDTIVMSGKLNDISGTAAVTMPETMDMSNPETMFVDGFATNANYSFGQADYIFDFDADGSKAAGSASMASGEAAVNFSAAGFDYDTLARGIAVSVQSGDLPFPINVSLAEYGIGLVMPLQKSEELSDFGLKINLTDLDVNDEIWMMGDPMGALPHDPATIKLDLSGKTKLFYDLTNPEQAEAMAMGGAPGELHALSLNDLQLKIAGALLTGTGAFTFDNTDMQSIPGMPRPEGEVTVNLTGANKLIDSLVGMGLLPEDQAMMGRMMMGMFARTVGDDQLSSTIEVNAQGHILANGQRIQ